MCKKIQIDATELFNLLSSGTKEDIKNKLAELYADYNKYSKTSQTIIDNLFLLGIDVLTKQ